MASPWLVFSATIVSAILWDMPASADGPNAIVEGIAAPGINLEFMEYVEAGRVIRLGPSGTITLGYLRSCWRETIEGGTVTIGVRKSIVVGGSVRRERIKCDGGLLELSTAEKRRSGVMTLRGQPPTVQAQLPESQLTIYGASPVITVAEPGGRVVIERLDKAGKAIEIKMKGSFVDFAQGKEDLEPGGLYLVRAGGRTVVFKIDPLARPGAGPIIGRLILL